MASPNLLFQHKLESSLLKKRTFYVADALRWIPACAGMPVLCFLALLPAFPARAEGTPPAGQPVDISQSPAENSQDFIELAKPAAPPKGNDKNAGRATQKALARPASRDPEDAPQPVPALTPAQASALAHDPASRNPEKPAIDPKHPPLHICDITATIIAEDYRVIISSPYSRLLEDYSSEPYKVASDHIIPYTAVYGAMGCDGVKLQNRIAGVLQQAVDAGKIDAGKKAPEKKE